MHGYAPTRKALRPPASARSSMVQNLLLLAFVAVLAAAQLAVALRSTPLGFGLEPVPCGP